jgi:hypothetical protein
MTLKELLEELDGENSDQQVVLRMADDQKVYQLDYVEYERSEGIIVLVSGEETIL